MEPSGKEYRLRIDEAELKVLTAALAEALMRDVNDVWVNVGPELDQLAALPLTDPKRGEVHDEIRKKSRGLEPRIRGRYLLLYRLTHMGPGRPWVSSWDLWDRSSILRVEDLLKRAIKTMETVPKE